MCSYNKINGVYASEDSWLLDGVLRGEWGFDGTVVSDWGAVRDRTAAVRAGCDLAMPYSGEESDAGLARAVQEGRLDSAALDRAASRVLRLLERADSAAHDPGVPDFDGGHALALEAARRSIVLLKNDDSLLPLQRSRPIGAFAAEPRYQGGGSSHVNASNVEVPLDGIRDIAGAGQSGLM